MIHSSKRLKDLIRNLSKEVGIESHVLIRKYMMEWFLERVPISKYNGSFILKGGMLISAFVGAEARATMDIDTTIICSHFIWDSKVFGVPCIGII